MDVKNSYNFSDSDNYEEDAEILEEKFILPTKRNLWETDNRCQSCLINFNILGIAHTKKTMCSFCYRGVCLKCLCFSRKHPESEISTKMCRACHYECKSIRHISGKLQQAKLEIEQLHFEVDLAIREKDDYTNQRKCVEQQINKVQNLLKLSHGEKIAECDKIKLIIEENEAKKTRIISANSELVEEKNKLLVYNKELLKFISDLKLGIKQNEESESKYRSRINKTQNKILGILKSHNAIENTTLVTEKIKNLTEETKDLQLKLENTNKLTQELEKELHSHQKNTETNELTVYNLHTKASETKALYLESDIFTEEQEKELVKKRSMLLEYDKIIKNLNDRLELLKKEAARQHKLNKGTTKGTLYGNNSLLAEYETARRSNTVTLHGSTSCKQCIIA
ncbi:hypothetical protein SteCoe_21683 [Stentor coeruleus]|uniref:FYVE-type domain-containing protein n=1 Tax=Stentor coeruleus TaxID=5963 RepID=A0A1R2BNZ5_9CILI|nr:hypothetical protein SteCoe_21683 [Stentor coeruleus]